MRMLSITALAGILSLGGCDKATGPGVTGTFILQTINGSALPATVSNLTNPPYKLEITAGNMAINSTFSDQITFKETSAGVVTTQTITCTGTFVRLGNTFIAFQEATTADCGRSFEGRLIGNSLTVALDATTQAVFSR